MSDDLDLLPKPEREAFAAGHIAGLKEALELAQQAARDPWANSAQFLITARITELAINPLTIKSTRLRRNVDG